MARRRSDHSGVPEILWRYLTDQSTEEDRDSWDWDFMAHMPDRRHGEWNFSTMQAWQDYEQEILSAWIPAFPGTRPRCWWRFTFGEKKFKSWYKKHRLHPDHPKNVWLYLDDILPLIDQREFLEAHDLLMPGE